MTSGSSQTSPDSASAISRAFRNPVILVIKIVVTAIVVTAIISGLDTDRLADVFGQTSLFLVAGAFFALAVQMSLQVFAWHALLGTLGQALPVRVVARITLLSLFFNQFVPGALGGVGIRVYYAWRENVPLSRAVASVMLERACFLFVLIFMVVVMTPVIADLGRHTVDPRAIYVGAIVVVAGLIVLFRWGERLIVPWRRRPLVEKAIQFLALVRGCFQHPIGLAKAFTFFLVYHSLSVTAFWLLANAVGGDPSMLELWALVPLVLLVAALPITINGWGLREGAAAAALSLIGIPAEQAVAIALIYGAGLLATRLPMGILWFQSGTATTKSGVSS